MIITSHLPHEANIITKLSTDSNYFKIKLNKTWAHVAGHDLEKRVLKLQENENEAKGMKQEKRQDADDFPNQSKRQEEEQQGPLENEIDDKDMKQERRRPLQREFLEKKIEAEGVKQEIRQEAAKILIESEHPSNSGKSLHFLNSEITVHFFALQVTLHPYLLRVEKPGLISCLFLCMIPRRAGESNQDWPKIFFVTP